MLHYTVSLGSWVVSNLWRLRVVVIVALLLFVLLLTAVSTSVVMAGQAPGGSYSTNGQAPGGSYGG